MTFPQNEMDTILNGIRDFILIISPDREILEVNDAFLKHMNYARKDVIGRKCYEVFKEVTRKSSNCHSKCPLEKVVREKRHCQAELTRLGSDGKIKYTELTIFPIWEKKGKISKFIEISRDITKRKTNEKQNQDHLLKMVEERTRQLKETHERMLHQDKMAFVLMGAIPFYMKIFVIQIMIFLLCCGHTRVKGQVCPWQLFES